MRRTRVEEACSARNFRAWSRRAFWSAEKSKFTAGGSYGIRGGYATGGMVREYPRETRTRIAMRPEEVPALEPRALHRADES